MYGIVPGLVPAGKFAGCAIPSRPAGPRSARPPMTRCAPRESEHPRWESRDALSQHSARHPGCMPQGCAASLRRASDLRRSASILPFPRGNGRGRGRGLPEHIIVHGDPYYNPNLSLATRVPTLKRRSEPLPIQRLKDIVKYT